MPTPSAAPRQEDLIDLHKIGELRLQVKRLPRPTIRDIASFSFGGNQDLCFVRREADGARSLVLVDAGSGDALGALSLPSKVGELVCSNPAWIGERRFAISLSETKVDGRAYWYVGNFNEGRLSRLAVENCPAVTAVAGLPDGGFAALTTRRMKYSSARGIHAFNALGALVWKREFHGSGGDPAEVYGPESLVWKNTNELAVLDGATDLIKLFDGLGTHLRNLKAKVTAPGGGLQSLCLDRKGGFVVLDSNGRDHIIRLDAAGNNLGHGVVQLGGGHRIPIQGMRVSPNHRIWVTDGINLLRLDGFGNTDLVLGQKSDSSRLMYPSLIHFDQHDRWFVQDRQSEAIFVFGRQGDEQSVLRPAYMTQRVIFTTAM